MVLRCDKMGGYVDPSEDSDLTNFARPVSQKTTALADVAMRPDAGLMMICVAILAVLLALLAGAAWTHVT